MKREDPITLADQDTEPQTTGQAGAALPSRYTPGSVIGRGGMGEVIAARDEQIGRSVAIKRLRHDPDPEMLARFMREARVQGRLEHPAVVPVHELAWDDANQPFFVMKHLTGVTLAEVLPKLWERDAAAVETFTMQRLLRAFAEVCLAIEFAHTRGVVHRDLKPANIMLGDFGEVYVLDWGIARIAGEESRRPSFADIDTIPGTETSAGAILGTPGYIAPEQIRGDADVDGRADVYALGCILFELLALRPLHPRGQAGISSALAGVDARPSHAAPDRDVPPELDEICVRATELERDARYPTARALGDAVQRYLDGNRDLALRKQLARVELDAARAALVLGDAPEHQRIAIRAAARAIALDPTERDAVELAGHLMLRPPNVAPPEVEQELARMDNDALDKSTRVGLIAAVSTLLFFPVLYWMGFRELWYHVVGVAICATVVFAVRVISRASAKASGWISIGANLALFTLLSWLLSPILVGAGPAILLLTLVVPFRLLRLPWPIALAGALATLSPWWLQGIGMGSRVSIDGGNIILHTAAASLDPLATFIGVSLYIGLLIHMAAYFTRLVDDDRRETRRTMQIQTWQLRQLMPPPVSQPPR